MTPPPWSEKKALIRSLVLALLEEVADAAQVAQALLADRAHEEDVALRPQSGRVHGADVLEKGREPGRVVADARRVEPGAFPSHLHVRAFGKHGVEMGGDHDQRPARRPIPHPEHVALRVDLDIGEAVGPEHVGVDLGALLLLEGRRLDLGELDHLLDPAVMLLVGRLHRLLVGGALHDAFDRLHVRGRRVLGRGRSCREDTQRKQRETASE